MPILCDGCGKPIETGVYHYNREALPVCATCWPIEQKVDEAIEARYNTPERKQEMERPRSA